MIERLALPNWDAPPRSLDDWLAALSARGLQPRVERTDGETWLEIPASRVRGFVVAEGGGVMAINFEFHAEDPHPALDCLTSVAASLCWALYDEDEDDEDEDADGVESD